MKRTRKITVFHRYATIGAFLVASTGFPLADTGEDTTTVIHGERPPIDLSAVPDSAFVKGVIHVKFKKEMSDHLDRTPIARAADGSLRFGIAGMDDVNRKHRLKRARLTFNSQQNRREFTPRHRAWGFHLWHTLELDSADDMRKTIADYARLPEIEYAEPEYKKKMLWTPDDALFNKQWHYRNTGQASGTPGCDIKLPEAWDIEKGSTEVIVAVVDGGIKYDHPDIAANMWSGRGYNFVNGNSTIIPHFHGTHVAGTISAVNNNAIGVCGIAGGSGAGDGVRLMSCQVFTDNSGGGFAEAYRYAADNGAAVSQNSWGYGSPGVYEQSVLNAIDYFNANGGGTVLGGGITIFAAGNANSNAQWWPGCYSGVIGVAATTNRDQKASFSNYGTWVDISAPGGQSASMTDSGNVFSTYSVADTPYIFMAGTSMACPHVSGVAALVLSYVPGKLSAAELRSILLSSTDNIDALNPGFRGQLGTGRLNAYKALLAAQPYFSRVSNPTAFSATLFNSTQINLAWTKNSNNNNVMVAWNSSATFGTPVTGTAYTSGNTIPGGGAVLYNGPDIAYPHTGISAGSSYYYKAWSVDGSNNYSTGKTAFVSGRSVSRAISITVPGPGIIIFEASGYFYFPNSQWWTKARVSLSLNSTVDPLYMAKANGISFYSAFAPYEVSRAMTVTSAGTYTVFLVGDMTDGTGAIMTRNNACAVFVPN